MRNIREQIRSPEEHGLFFNAFQFAAIGMALVAPDGRWLKVNKALCDIVGYSEEELVTFTFQDITHPDDLEEDLENLHRLLRGELDTYQLEKRYFHKDGSVIYILLSVSLVRDEAGDPLFFISQIQNITDRKLLERELTRQAKVDSLTGLNNRRHFYELAEKDLLRGGRYNDPMVMLMIDIDHFKKINDRFGHSIGDLALVKIAEIFREGFRSFDIFGRMGGEEFGALLIKTDAEIGHKIAERLRKSVENLIIPTDKGVLRFTVSIGGVAFAGEKSSIDDRLKQADEALYQAKKGGRNRVVVKDNIPVEEHDTEELGVVRLEWRKEYECGNRVIDEQHHTLFRLANSLLNVMVEKRDKSVCLSHIDKLNREVSNHFTTEEKLIKEAGYPGILEHQQLHDALLREAKEMAARYRAGSLELGTVFQFLVMQVVQNHMLKEDRKFARFMKAAGDDAGH